MKKQEIEQRLQGSEKGSESHRPPGELLARIQAEIPARLRVDSASSESTGVGPSRRRSGLFLRIAASLVGLLLAGVLGFRFQQQRQGPGSVRLEPSLAATRAFPNQSPASGAVEPLSQEPPVSEVRREAAVRAAVLRDAASLDSEPVSSDAGLESGTRIRDDQIAGTLEDSVREPEDLSAPVMNRPSSPPSRSLPDALVVPVIDSVERETAPDRARKAPQLDEVADPERDDPRQEQDRPEPGERESSGLEEEEKVSARGYLDGSTVASAQTALPAEVAPAESSEVESVAAPPRRVPSSLVRQALGAAHSDVNRSLEESTVESETVEDRSLAARSRDNRADSVADEDSKAPTEEPILLEWTPSGLVVQGRVEPGSRIRLERKPVDVAEDGAFRALLARERWPRFLRLVIVAADGTESRRRLQVPER